MKDLDSYNYIGQNGLQYPRFVCIYKPSGTKSFRLASSKLFGFGANGQNFPKSVKLFIPDPGMVFAKVDQAGAEARVVAYLCRAGPYRELFEYGIKCHSFVAMHLFKDKFKVSSKALTASPKELSQMDEWVNHLSSVIANSPREYAIGKQVSHASNYGIGGSEFSINVLEKSGGTLVVSTKEAQRFIDTYLSLFSEIGAWQQRTINEVKAKRVLRNCFGFPREFNQILTPNYLKEALSFISQSTVGTLNNIVFTQMQDYIDSASLKWILLQNLHDSVMLECPPEEKELADTKLFEFYGSHELQGRDCKFRMVVEKA